MNEPTNPPDQPQGSDSTPPPPPPPPFTAPPAPSVPTPPPPSTPIAPPRPPVYTPPAGEPPKKSAMPWVLGGCGCLALLVILAAIICWMVYRAKQRVNELEKDLKSSLEQPRQEQRRPNLSPAPTTPASKTTPSTRTQTSVPRAGWNIYVNEKDKLPSGLQSKFVAFSFQYPRTFELQPQSDANFVKVEKYTAAGKGNTSENFAVGYARFDDVNTQSEALYNQLLDQLGQQLSGGFHNYKELKRNSTTVDGIKCRTALFQADFADAPNIQIFGKTIVVHPPGKEYGVTILMLGTSMSRDIKSADDLGTKGDTADIVRSFTFL